MFLKRAFIWFNEYCTYLVPFLWFFSKLYYHYCICSWSFFQIGRSRAPYRYGQVRTAGWSRRPREVSFKGSPQSAAKPNTFPLSRQVSWNIICTSAVWRVFNDTERSFFSFVKCCFTSLLFSVWRSLLVGIFTLFNDAQFSLVHSNSK